MPPNPQQTYRGLELETYCNNLRILANGYIQESIVQQLYEQIYTAIQQQPFVTPFALELILGGIRLSEKLIRSDVSTNLSEVIKIMEHTMGIFESQSQKKYPDLTPGQVNEVIQWFEARPNLFGPLFMATLNGSHQNLGSVQEVKNLYRYIKESATLKSITPYDIESQQLLIQKIIRVLPDLI